MRILKSALVWPGVLLDLAASSQSQHSGVHNDGATNVDQLDMMMKTKIILKLGIEPRIFCV